MRTFLAVVVLATTTPYYALRVMLAALVGVKDREGSIYRRALRRWGRLMCGAAGARVTLPGGERLADGKPRVLVANHVSWYDVFALSATLPSVAFIAKAEMRGIPLLGRAMLAAGHLFVDRKNQKAAFAAYDDAAVRIRNGTTVVIFPEGTRGFDYPLRPFKKGPFVLAVAAGVPVTPILLHGTLDVLRKGSFRVRKHDIEIHVLDDISTEGCSYDDRDRLALATRNAMSAAQERLYGVTSPEWNPRGVMNASSA